jgi:hypothetical protein
MLTNIRNSNLRNSKARVSTAQLNRRRYKQRDLEQTVSDAIPNLGWETTQTINLLLKKTRSKMDLL